MASNIALSRMHKSINIIFVSFTNMLDFYTNIGSAVGLGWKMYMCQNGMVEAPIIWVRKFSPFVFISTVLSFTFNWILIFVLCFQFLTSPLLKLILLNCETLLFLFFALFWWVLWIIVLVRLPFQLFLYSNFFKKL